MKVKTSVFQSKEALEDIRVPEDVGQFHLYQGLVWIRKSPRPTLFI